MLRKSDDGGVKKWVVSLEVVGEYLQGDRLGREISSEALMKDLSKSRPTEEVVSEHRLRIRRTSSWEEQRAVQDLHVHGHLL
jgi:hypothetical protein